MKGRTLKSPGKGNNLEQLPGVGAAGALSSPDKLESSIGSLGSDKKVLGEINRDDTQQNEKNVKDMNPVPPLKQSETEPDAGNNEADSAVAHEKSKEQEEEVEPEITPDEMKELVGDETLEDKLNAVEVASPQRQKAISSQFVDRSFFASLAIKKSSS